MLLARRRPPGHARRPWRCDHGRAFVDARVKWIRDRGLDHAVEKEKHLLPFHNLKDLLLTSTSTSTTASAHSLPLSFIADRRDELRLPFRAIRFIRLFPSAFIEELPASAAAPRPHIRPTPELLRLHSDEQRAVDDSRADAADRLLRLLMLAPRRRLPLRLVDRLRWDLGLPHDYPRSLLPDYPDYFQIVPRAAGSPDDLDLELVCYSKDLAVSAMERYAARTGGYKKGAPLAFPLSYPRGFDLEKKVKNWVDEWQKLPYVSPYEDGSNLPLKSDLAEKWTVGVLHELLHLLIGKKTEKDNLVLLGEHVGLRPGFRKVITHHPGIFYISNKLRTQTIVLREAYRRDLLLEKHPLMGLRYQYIHLMHKGKETSGSKKDRKSKRAAPRSMHDHNTQDDVDDLEGEGEDEEDDDDDDDDEEEEEEEEDMTGTSDTETEDEESDDEDVDSNAIQERVLPHRGESRRHIDVKGTMPRGSSAVRMSAIENHLRTSKANVEMNRRVNYGRADKRQSLKKRAST